MQKLVDEGNRHTHVESTPYDDYDDDEKSFLFEVESFIFRMNFLPRRKRDVSDASFVSITDISCRPRRLIASHLLASKSGERHCDRPRLKWRQSELADTAR